MNVSPPSIRSDQLLVGTRGSALALAQTGMVIRLLQIAHPDLTFSQSIVSTEGDRDKTSPLTMIGGRGVFTSALQERLLSGDIDLAVHSAKDVPSISPSGLEIAAFPDREDPRDALISRHGVSLQELPRQPVIGTSSRRRAVQILALRPDAIIRELRGNIDTRLRKAESHEYDAIILAVAGVTRMGWTDRITEFLDVERFTPSPAQGAIAVEARIGDVADIALAIDQRHVSNAVRLERRFLRAVGGGCTTPIGAHARATPSGMVLHAMLADDRGDRLVRDRIELNPLTSDDAIDQLAAQMLSDTRLQWSTHGVKPERQPVTVLMTGSSLQVHGLASELERRGFETLHLETIRIGAPTTSVADLIPRATDWVVITSPNAEPYVRASLIGLVESGARLAVVGQRTASAIQRHGLVPDVIGEGGASSLADQLIDRGIDGATVVAMVSDRAHSELADRLQGAGASVQVIEAYRTVPVASADRELIDRIESGVCSVVTLASPSAVESLKHLLGSTLAALSGASFVAIGETTAKAMRDHDLPVHAIAQSPTAESFADAIMTSLGSSIGFRT
ncbi:MAG: hydroxymethylbilane synthase [Thermomicrobiales bacterium]